MPRFLSRLPAPVLAAFLAFWVNLFAVIDCPAAGTPDLTTAQQDDDFAIQGEYVGVDQAMQVIARGEGEFDLVIFEGGLPGAGAKPNPRRIESDRDTVEDLIDSMKLTRVERKSPTLGRPAPVGATVLFDGSQASAEQHWDGARVSEEGWLMQGTQTRQTFGDYQLHVEFQTPWAPERTGQQRGNSGIYHQARYETQVLDSFGCEGLDNEAGGIYTVSAPSVNACFPPLTWQTYDVDFTAARYDEAGKKIANARMTVRLNGIMVQNDVEVPKSTTASKLQEGPQPGPIYLQDHGDPVRFRNIWLLPRDADREARRPIVPGFERFVGTESTSTADAGALLVSNLACAACHSQGDAASGMLPDQRGPDLNRLAGRVRHDAIHAMIADPHAAKPNTTMPDPWPGADAATRKNNAAKIASYLIARGTGQIADRPVNQALIDQGEKLYHTVGCVACHASRREPSTPHSTSVPLGELHRKYTVPSLAAFLRNCNEVRPGIRMPALVGNGTDATAIAAYLTGEVTKSESTAGWVRKIYRGKWENLPNFDELEPVKIDEVGTLKIDDIRPNQHFGIVFEGNLSIEADGKYRFVLRSDDGSRLRIGDQELVNDGIHPANNREATFELKAGIQPIRVEYFDGGGQIELSLQMDDPQMGRSDISTWILTAKAGAGPLDLLPSDFQPDASLVDEGRRLFATAGCVNCHVFADATSDSNLTYPSLAPAWNQIQPGRGCLSDQVKSPAVDYQLGSTQVAAIESMMSQSPKTTADKATADTSTADTSRAIHLTLAALNCYACHVRNSIGGPEPSRDGYFTTTIPEMGWEGRLPPPLDGVADKLNDDYLTSVLKNGANARDYMGTRMPAFHDEKLKPLIAALIQLERRDEMQSTQTDLSDEEVVINGRKLCGDEGLSCIKCHSFGGDKGGGLGAIDMLMMPQRLRPSWFQRYLQDPTKYRPGTRMPNSFVDGRSAIVDINDGSPPLQIDAMWKYLSLGNAAKEPLGLNQAAIVLKAVERPRLYRNFFSDISARGIGVAYPTRVNLLWDAEQMSLARIWRNEFVDASMHWVGRGQGRQKPQGDAITTIDVAMPIISLDSDNVTDRLSATWPTQTARELGYRFVGYRLDADGNPMFGYRINESLVEDYPVANEKGFDRQLIIDAKEDLVVQLGSGKIEVSDGGYRINDEINVHVEGIELSVVNLDGKSFLRGIVPSGTKTTITQIIRW
ncbi:family 16 glycoside hydrolase [Neorhodopirellula pilleata]|uniref:Cytochrome c n=1 Tax=Neorhodopirellula pilleata TaxID=2714738 RepID=A0A5C6AR69_9BACT|nr:family 16 glycoside hydrolase [Neorhodopirellula pilleata]TWU01997.1 Cytochrome c [Neorhodopirellula pilleata]